MLLSIRPSRRVLACSALGAAALLPLSALAAQSDDGNTDRSAAIAAAIDDDGARSVILLIGDGMGDSEITSARYYQYGAAGELALDTLPFTGSITTYSVMKDNPSVPDYDPESASTGTAWATGYKSYDGAISVRPDGTPAPSILELARDAGFRTGNVSTAEIEDATPAVMGSHISNRGCKGPNETTTLCPDEATEAGGPGSIAEQLAESGTDVLLGGGLTYFQQAIKDGEYEGDTVLAKAESLGYSVVTDATGLAAADADKPVLGLFAPTNMDVEWTGPPARRGGTPTKSCKPNADRAEGQPHLSTMADTAIDLLEEKSRTSDKGFFLQIEGASIDKQDHAANACGQIGELVEFDNAVKVALAYQQRNPDTLVIVTGDHAHTSQIVEAGSTTPGLTVSLQTNEGAELTISYATAKKGESQQHTGSQIRIAASGPQAANFLGLTDQTDTFYTITRALGIR